jgi:hypothetical protein
MNRVLAATATCLVSVFALIAASYSDAIDSSGGSTWRSKHLNVSATIPDGWRSTHINSPGDTFDLPDKVLAAFVNKSGPYGYILRVEKDVPIELVSFETYVAAVRDQFASHESYEAIDEERVLFHDHPFHRLRFRVEGAKGPAAMYVFIHRDGNHFVNIQWTFPIIDGKPISVPLAITEFDANVTLPLRPVEN